MIFYNGVFHNMIKEDETFYGMEVAKGHILRMYKFETELPRKKRRGEMVNLDGVHVYPCREISVSSVFEGGMCGNMPVKEAAEFQNRCIDRGIGLVRIRNEKGPDKDEKSEKMLKNAAALFDITVISETKECAYGTLESGRPADFFITATAVSGSDPQEDICPIRMYIGGKQIRKIK